MSDALRTAFELDHQVYRARAVFPLKSGLNSGPASPQTTAGWHTSIPGTIRVYGSFRFRTLRGGKPIPVPELKGVTPVRYWTVQRGKLYFIRQEQSPRDLEELDLQTRRIRKLMQIPGTLLAGTPGLTVDPAAHTLLFVQMGGSTSHILFQVFKNN